MADHVRTQIRGAAVTALTGLTTTGAKVYPSRTKPMAAANLPGLKVYTNDEQVEKLDISADPMLERNLELVVEACAKQSDDLDDVLDTMAKEVEIALNNTTLGGLIKSIGLGGIQVEMDSEGEKPVGVATMTFNVSYHTQASAPDVAL